MIATVVRALALAPLALASFGYAQAVPSPAAAPMAAGMASDLAATDGMRGGGEITIKNDVQGCTAFVTGDRCGGEITLAPFQTVTRRAECKPNHASLKCGSGRDGTFIRCNNGNLRFNGRHYAVEGLAHDACTLIRRA